MGAHLALDRVLNPGRHGANVRRGARLSNQWRPTLPTARCDPALQMTSRGGVSNPGPPLEILSDEGSLPHIV